MHKVLKIGLALCIVCSLFVFISATDFEKVANSLEKIGYKFGALLLITLVAYYLGTLSWKYCLGEKSNAVSIYRLFMIRHVGETLALVNPASIVGGDAFKGVLLKADELDQKTVIVSIISSRMVMILTQLLLFFFVALILFTNQNTLSIIPAAGNTYIVYYGTAGLCLFLAIAWFFRSWLKQKLKPFLLKVAEIIEGLKHHFKYHKYKLFLSCVFATLHWFFGALEFYLILKFLNIEVTVIQALLVDMGVIFFKTAGAFIPGQIGIEEYGNKIMLMTIGIPGTEIWIVASILRRTRQLVWIVLGIAIYFLVFKNREPALLNTSS
ncbi:flippase-like domain-containing protein [Pedobacter sp. MC2016-14]|uniref:lysylphosphatidylglycerol synthase transmembrane domain-containing protein n=1 Tax=Pedobacter sp. MC2016-14 TaxID=2897327 RepID=UPI001E5B3082|nr:lysylphosphatidylglycerol synthase transmembrane domain-containing protein [Pedobacter sp. MC2016-14]MCD0488350.1 flippase-like domain-containing protein [Pedobacter sp. MC2016-14]